MKQYAPIVVPDAAGQRAAPEPGGPRRPRAALAVKGPGSGPPLSRGQAGAAKGGGAAGHDKT